MFLQRVEVQRHVGQRGRQDAARGATRQVALEVVAFGHAAAVFLDQLADGDPRRRQLDPGLAHPARDGKGAQPLAPMAAVAGEPVGALLDDLAHPVEGLHVVRQRRQAEEPDLGREGRLVARQAALALDRLHHRRLLAADVGAGTASQIDRHPAEEVRFAQAVQLTLQDLDHRRIFVADVDVDRLDLAGPAGDQGAFKEPVGIEFQVVTVLEGSGLALVAVDRQDPGFRLLAHQLPFAAGGKACSPKTAQAGVL